MLDDKPQALDQSFIDGMRRRIRVADIIEMMQNHVLDRANCPMSKTQIQAAQILLKKVMPDMQQVGLTGGAEFGAAFARAMKASDEDNPI
jgi:hypothetical protein